MDRRGFLQIVAACVSLLDGIGCSGRGSRTAQEREIEQITPNLVVVRGAANGGLLLEGSRVLAIPGDPRGATEAIAIRLFPDARRDAQWPGLEGAVSRILVPDGAEELFQSPGDFWSLIHEERFHDYVQPSPHVITEPVPVTETVSGGQTISWAGRRIEVLATPGYTPHAVSYLIEDEGRRVAFTGDLLYGDGQVLDLFSLQDGIPQENVLGYHGYMVRASKLIESLQAILAWEPHVVVPARGPIVREPGSSAGRLIRRLQRIYESYASTTALRWIPAGREHVRTHARRLLGGNSAAGPTGSAGESAGQPRPIPEAVAEAETRDPPSWIVPIRNSRLLVSESGAGFLIDCGHREIIEAVDHRIGEQQIHGVEGIYVTHYHDDHTDRVQEAADHFKCPVYCCSELEDILRHPTYYWMPAQTRRPIHSLEVMEEGERMRWHEFTFTFSHFPGQTRYHGGLRVDRVAGSGELEGPIFFIGDSFTPTGLNDHCMQNRNLMHSDTGYLLCLSRLQEMDPLPWLVNQHVEPIFRFSKDQIHDLAEAFRTRRDLIARVVPWEDPNFGIDAHWARCYPYEVRAEGSSPVSLEVQLFNHADRRRPYSIRPNAPEGWEVTTFEERAVIDSRREAALKIELRPTAAPPPQLAVLTVDIHTPERTLRKWVEALLTSSAKNVTSVPRWA